MQPRSNPARPRGTAFVFGLTLACAACADGQELSNGSAPTQGPQTQSPAIQTPTSPSQPQAGPATPSNQSNDFWTRTYFTGNWNGVRDQLKNDGFAFNPIWTGEVFGNPSGGAKRGLITDGLVNVPVDFDLDPMTDGAVKDTTIHANAFYIYGTSLSAAYVGDFSDTSNIAAYNTLRLDELWIQKLFWDKKISLKVGNMAVDNEFFQSNSAALFISGTFGAFTFIANNVPDAPVYPLASPGIRLQLLPDPRFYVMAGVYGLDNNSDPSVNNKNGTLFPLKRPQRPSRHVRGGLSPQPGAEGQGPAGQLSAGLVAGYRQLHDV